MVAKSSKSGHGVKEQKNKKSRSRKQLKRQDFFGPLESKMLALAGKELGRVLEDKGRAAAESFYLFLHESTKNYIRNHKPYSIYLKIIQYGGM